MAHTEWLWIRPLGPHSWVLWSQNFFHTGLRKDTWKYPNFFSISQSAWSTREMPTDFNWSQGRRTECSVLSLFTLTLHYLGHRAAAIFPRGAQDVCLEINLKFSFNLFTAMLLPHRYFFSGVRCRDAKSVPFLNRSILFLEYKPWGTLLLGEGQFVSR